MHEVNSCKVRYIVHVILFLQQHWIFYVWIREADYIMCTWIIAKELTKYNVYCIIKSLFLSLRVNDMKNLVETLSKSIETWKLKQVKFFFFLGGEDLYGIDAYRCILGIKIAKGTKHSGSHMCLLSFWH